tara:strand:- start:325 stop:1842 length:1518 start_codon:yes stop_codon:yes gene_type:complete
MKYNSRYSIYSILYIIGLLNWFLFFNFGEPKFYYEDWPLFHSIYEVWQISLKEKTIPFFANLFSQDSLTHKDAYGTDKFFTKSWSIFQPQLFLLNFINIKLFITLNYCLFYTILFYSLTLWINYFKLSTLSSIFLIIVLTLNGKLMSISGFGHAQMTFGYMLIPSFLWILNKFIVDEENTFKRLMQLSLFMSLVIQQTDMHIYYQMFVVGGLIIIFFPKKYKDFFLVFLISFITSAWYVVPIIFFSSDLNVYDTAHWRYYGIFGFGFQNGFAGNNLLPYISHDSYLITLLKFIVNYFLHIYESAVGFHNAGMPNTHEYNSYISIIGFIIIIFFLLNFIYHFFKKNIIIKKDYYKLLLSCFLILLLSAGPTHFFIIKSIKTLFNFNFPLIDAVPSRYYYYFFNILCIFTAVLYSNYIKDKGFVIKLFFINLNLLLIVILLFHAQSWWITNSFQLGSQNILPEHMNAEILSKDNNITYKYTVITSFIFSSMMTLFLIYASFYKSYKN